MDQLDRIEERLVRIEGKIDQKVDNGFELRNGIYVPKHNTDQSYVPEVWNSFRMPITNCDFENMFMNEVQSPEEKHKEPPAVDVRVKYKKGKSRRNIGRVVQPKRLKKNDGKG